MSRQCRPDLWIGATQIVENTGRQVGIANTVRQQPARPRRRGSSLEHDRIAGNQRRGDRPTRECEREVEWVDDYPGTIGLQHAAVA